MSRVIVYKGMEEEKKISRVQRIEDNGSFYRVKYNTMFNNSTKVTNIRKDRVIRYDE